MHIVGVRELKNRLTYYLGLTKEGNRVIVTDRGAPIAVLHSIDKIEKDAGFEEKLALLARQGKIRLPKRGTGLTPFRPVKVKGRPVSETVIEERR
ncbi:MAG: hypothetical protein A2069_06930 [Planctomycetes bacterium GWB2_41_19]|nr:MAG: hypothetical protein A2069_06930 [Planctomycetes bacterium GWB2_41_19]